MAAGRSSSKAGPSAHPDAAFEDDDPPGRQRLDKWLWHARFVKTRSLATALCAAGSVRCGGAPVKAHFQVKPGDVVTFVLHGRVRIARILALADRRGPASAARSLYEDLSPTEPNPLPMPGTLP